MNGNQWRALIVAGMIGLAAGSGSAFTLGQTGALRPDPFTGSQATQLRLELEAKIERERRERRDLERRLRDLENWVARQKKNALKR